MINGNNTDKCFTDMKYNLELSDVKKIVTTKKALKSEVGRLARLEPTDAIELEKASLNYMLSNFDKVILPSIYNNVSGCDTQSSFHKCSDGTTQDVLKNVSRMTDKLSDIAGYEEGSILQKSINSIYDQYSDIVVSEPTEKEMQQQMEKVSKMTKSTEESEEPPSTDDNPLKDKTGYKQLEEWLKQMQGSRAKKKQFRQMTKMSDLQKVSVIEFIKPRGLLMKKIVNKELYCKVTAESERYMHVMIDRSGSMGDYQTWRNALLIKTYEDCVNMNINVEVGFWNTSLIVTGKYGPQKIHSRKELEEKSLSVRPSGNDQMGSCVMEKLMLLQRRATKQYVLCMSDGTGSINDSEQRIAIEELAASKNIELKYALFSRNNEMYGTEKKDIFYIYD